MSRDFPVLKPGATIGILGGGQLGRMLALAAAELGLASHIFAPEVGLRARSTSQARRRVRLTTTRPRSARFADAVDVITYEFENVPAATADFLGKRRPVLPNHGALAIIQDRLPEKEFVAKLGIATAPFAKVDSAAEREGRRRADRLAGCLEDTAARL